MSVPETFEPLPDLLLIARIETRRFAVSANLVERILPMVEVTPVVGSAAEVLGLINLHGAILPVVNLRPMLGLESVAIDPAQHLVVVAAARRFALWIDQAESVVPAEASSFDRIATPQALAALVFRLAGEVIPVLSLAAIDPGARIAVGDP